MNKTKHLVSCIEKSLKVCAVSVLSHCVFLPLSYAGPTGGNIVGGSGNINQSNLNTTINQLSNRLAIDWQTFNINSNESVNFNQPNRSSIALNRILDQNASQIHGSINANGQIVLVNPNGVFFGKNSTVNAGGLFAAALDVNSEDFMQGRLDFKALENSSGLIINEGRLEVIDGGALVLLGQKVENRGMLVANFGTVAIAAGHDISVRFSDYENFSININQNDLANILGLNNPSVLNTGLIQAHNGNVVLTAKQADAIKSSINNVDNQQAFSFSSGQIIEKNGVVYLAGPDGDISDLGVIDVSNEMDAGLVIYSAENINHSGSINADTQTGVAGTVRFDANDTTLLSGNSTISAQATVEGVGGSVHVLGNHVGLIDNASINTSGVNGGGEVLIGGDYQGKNPQIKNAEAVYLGENTQINADAIEEGDGGKIIVWSDKASRVYGELSAKGGGVSGNGGFIETSSHDYIDLSPEVNVSAVNGLHGQWLIDPAVLTISNNASDNPVFPSFPNFTTSDNISNLRISELEDALEAGANITIQTSVPVDIPNQPCGGVVVCLPATDITPETMQVAAIDQVGVQTYFYGDIVLVDNLDIDNIGSTRDGENASSLTLTAHRDIVINGAIFDSDIDNDPGTGFVADGDILNLTLQANTGPSNNASLGSVRINNNIDLQGGNFTASGVSFVQAANTTINTSVPVPAATSGFDPVAVFGGAGVTPNGDVNITATSGSITANGNIIAAGSTDLSATGTITLNNNLNDFGVVNINNGTAVTLADNNNLTTNINSNSVTSIATNTGVNSTIIDVDNINGTVLAAMTVGGNLDVTSAGGISDSGAITVNGASTIFRVAGGSDIILDNENNFNSTVQFLVNSGAGNINNLNIRDISSFDLEDITVDGYLTASSGGALTINDITMDGAQNLTLTTSGANNDITHVLTGNTALNRIGSGTNTFSASGDIVFNDQVHNLNEITINQAGTASFDNGVNAIVLNGVNATNLNVTATGGIADSDFIVVSGLTTLDAGMSNITFNNFTFNNPDYTSANLGNVNITNANQVLIYEQDNINISGTMGRLDIIAGLGNTPSTIGNVSGETLQVTGITSLDLLNSGAVDLTVGAAQSDLQGNVSIGNAIGNVSDVTLNNVSNLELSTLNLLNAGAATLDLKSDVGITQTGAFTVDGATTLEAATVSLTQNNDFNNLIIDDTNNAAASYVINDNAGGINVVANNNDVGNTVDLTLTSNGAVAIEGDLLNVDISTTSGGIQNTGLLTVTNNTNLTAAATDNVDFQTNQVNLKNLNVVMANNVLINEVDDLQVNSATVNGLMDIDATDTVSVNGNIANLDISTVNTISLSGSVGILNAVTTAGGIQNGTAALTVIDTAALDAGVTSNVTLDNAANDFARVAIVSAQDVSLRDVNGLQLMAVNSDNLTVMADGDITQAPASVLTVDVDTNLSSGNGDIILTEENMLTNLSITGGNSATVVNGRALLLNDSSLLNNIDISTTTGNLSLNNIGANGSASFSAADAIIDVNGDALNVSATSASFAAANGIGTVGGTGDINIQAANLSALNTTSGDINIKNTGGDITLVNIVNNATDTGNFNFQSTDDVLIDNITLQQNLIEEFSPNGTGTVDMFTADGSFLGVGDEDVNNPDITATNLRLVGVRGNLGTLQRPLVLDISGKVELFMRASLDPIYIDPVPNPETDIRDESVLQFTSADTLAAANGVQITEVETLLDIDPAIFTDIRHFVVGSEPVLLPRDQLFDVENENEDEDDEFFKRISGEEGPLEN